MNYAAVVLFVADATMWLHDLNTILNIVYA